MKKSFRDQITNILTAWGYVESNGNDLGRAESDDFNLEPGRWRLEGDQWVAVTPSLAYAKKAKLAEINAEFDREASAIKETYPEAEVDSWPEQAREARALLDNPAVLTPLVDGIAFRRSMSREELAGKIIAKAGLFSDIIAPIIGKRQVLEKQIEGATAEQINGISW